MDIKDAHTNSAPQVNGHRTATAENLSPGEAHELVVELEHAGVPPTAIDIEGVGMLSKKDMQKADSRMARRARSRITAGAAIGALIGLAVGAALNTLTTVTGLGAYIGALIAGALLGGLIGLYSGLTLQQDAAATDVPGPKRVRVDLSSVDMLSARYAKKIVEKPYSSI